MSSSSSEPHTNGGASQTESHPHASSPSSDGQVAREESVTSPLGGRMPYDDSDSDNDQPTVRDYTIVRAGVAPTLVSAHARMRAYGLNDPDEDRLIRVPYNAEFSSHLSSRIVDKFQKKLIDTDTRDSSSEEDSADSEGSFDVLPEIDENMWLSDKGDLRADVWVEARAGLYGYPEKITISDLNNAPKEMTIWCSRYQEPVAPEDDTHHYVLEENDESPLFKWYLANRKVKWTEEDIDPKEDIVEMRKSTQGGVSHGKVSDYEFEMVKYLLAFFAGADGMVNENLFKNVMSRFEDDKDMSLCFHWQMAMEDIHNLTYNRILKAYVPNPQERNTLANSITEIPVINKKMNWAVSWIRACESRPEALSCILIAFILVEDVQFSASFALISFLKKKGVLLELGKANELIIVDENNHVNLSVHALRRLYSHPPVDMVHQMAREVCQLEMEYTIAILEQRCTPDQKKHVIPTDFIGMKFLMLQYIRFKIDNSLFKMGYPPLDDFEEICATKGGIKKQPLYWMMSQGHPTKANFFETQHNPYGKLPQK